MFMRSKLTTKEEKKENWKLQAAAILLGVVLIVLMHVLSEIFETPVFFDIAIMLLSLIVVNLSYLVELRIKEQNEKRRAN